MGYDFELIGDITEIETIAVNLSIRELQRLKEQSSRKNLVKIVTVLRE